MKFLDNKFTEQSPTMQDDPVGFSGYIEVDSKLTG